MFVSSSLITDWLNNIFPNLFNSVTTYMPKSSELSGSGPGSYLVTDLTFFTAAIAISNSLSRAYQHPLVQIPAQNNPDQSTVKRIKAIWPKMTITNSDTVDFYVGTQMSTEEGVSWKGPFTFNPDTQSKVSCRASGKYYGVKIETTTDTDWRLEGLEFELEDAGRRGSRNY